MWKDLKTKNEVLSVLKKINNKELIWRDQKSLTNFKKLKEYKFINIRIITITGQNATSDKIV